MIEQRIFLPIEDEVRREIRVKKIATYLAALDLKLSWEVLVQPFKHRRSLPQNSYLWAIYDEILERGGEEMGGWEKEDLHEFFLGECFGWETRVLYGRKRLKPLKRSSKLNKQEFSDFLEYIMRFMAERGVHLPSPEERAA